MCKLHYIYMYIYSQLIYNEQLSASAQDSYCCQKFNVKFYHNKLATIQRNFPFFSFSFSLSVSVASHFTLASLCHTVAHLAPSKKSQIKKLHKFCGTADRQTEKERCKRERESETKTVALVLLSKFTACCKQKQERRLGH